MNYTERIGYALGFIFVHHVWKLQRGRMLVQRLFKGRRVAFTEVAVLFLDLTGTLESRRWCHSQVRLPRLMERSNLIENPGFDLSMIKGQSLSGIRNITMNKLFLGLLSTFPGKFTKVWLKLSYFAIRQTNARCSSANHRGSKCQSCLLLANK